MALIFTNAAEVKEFVFKSRRRINGAEVLEDELDDELPPPMVLLCLFITSFAFPFDWFLERERDLDRERFRLRLLRLHRGDELRHRFVFDWIRTRRRERERERIYSSSLDC